MVSNLDRRLSKIEAVEFPKTRIIIWLDDKQTPEEAVAARFPDGVPDDAAINLLRWSTEPEATTMGNMSGLMARGDLPYAPQRPASSAPGPIRGL
jgi:hypothetical protein